jgi:hypothetical protein
MAQPTLPPSFSHDALRERAAQDAAEAERAIARLRDEVSRLEQHLADTRWFLGALDHYVAADNATAAAEATQGAPVTTDGPNAPPPRPGDDIAATLAWAQHPDALLTHEWADWVARVARRAGVSHSRSDAAVVVQAMCRCLHMLEVGTDVGEPAATEWAARAVQEPWRTTVVRSRRWRADPTPDDRATLDAQRFVAWVAEQATARGSS